MISNLSMNLEGIEFEVHFDFEPYESGDMECAPSGPFLDIEMALFKGTDFLPIFSKDQIEDLEQRILKYYGDQVREHEIFQGTLGALNNLSIRG